MIEIRKMMRSDIEDFTEGFSKQGWHKENSLYEQYYSEQESGQREVFVATIDGAVAGYATLLKKDSTGPFKEKNTPVICDFNVLIKCQRQGIGTAIMDHIEARVKEYSPEICLGVGLHSGYGAAQRMYVKRGYIPDGSGVWYQERILEQYAPCANDDDLILYLSKKL